MNISTALKEKNRITGRINKLQNQIKGANKHQKDKIPDFNSKDLLVKLQEEWAHLINLKIKISQANIGIMEKLIQLTEAKAELKFWQDMIAYSGKSEETDYKSAYENGQYVDKPFLSVSDISSLAVSNNVDRRQSEIEKLQDIVDVYNGFTQI